LKKEEADAMDTERKKTEYIADYKNRLEVAEACRNDALLSLTNLVEKKKEYNLREAPAPERKIEIEQAALDKLREEHASMEDGSEGHVALGATLEEEENAFNKKARAFEEYRHDGEKLVEQEVFFCSTKTTAL